MPEKQSIGLALAAIISDIGSIKKDKRNEQQGFKFRGIDDVYNALHPVFAAHGVTCVPRLISHNTTVVKVGAQSKDTFRTVVTMSYQFTASDGSFVEACTVGEGMDFGDKSTAKAMSVAQKYLMLQMFLIPTADIVDADASDPTIDPRAELAELHAENKRYRDLENKRMEAGSNLKGAQYVDGHAPAESTEAKPATRTRKPKDEPVAATPEPEKAAPTVKDEPENPSADPEPATGWKAHKIAMKSAPEFDGKMIADLSDDQLERIYWKWAKKPEFQEKINGNPATKHQAEMIIAAHDERFGPSEAK